MASLPITHGAVYMAKWRQCAEAILDKPEPGPRPRELNHHRLPDGSSTGSFGLDAAGAEELERAIATAARWDGPSDERNAARKRGDAFFEVLAFFNKNHDKTGTPRHRPHVEIVIEAGLDGRPYASTPDGRPVDPCAARAWMCDALFHRVTRSGNNRVLDYGVAMKSFPFPVFRAIVTRDCGCRFPGCDRPPRWCDAHHVVRRVDHGPTSYENGCLLCSRHHHMIHHPGWRVSLLPNGDLEVVRPDGVAMTSHPRPTFSLNTKPPPGQLAANAVTFVEPVT